MKGILTSIFAVLTISGLHAQTQQAAPKLVVTVTIDQLRTDYLETFSPLYGEKGFKRLLRDGNVYKNAGYDFDNVDRSSAIASFYTGTTPSVHGIIANRWMDRNTLRPVSCVDDTEYLGNYTTENSSPVLLLSSTVADELKIATRLTAFIYSTALYSDASILSAGHCAARSYGTYPNTGKWCVSTSYL